MAQAEQLIIIIKIMGPFEVPLMAETNNGPKCVVLNFVLLAAGLTSMAAPRVRANHLAVAGIIASESVCFALDGCQEWRCTLKLAACGSDVLTDVILCAADRLVEWFVGHSDNWNRASARSSRTRPSRRWKTRRRRVPPKTATAVPR